jgi:hypothetical protein
VRGRGAGAWASLATRHPGAHSPCKSAVATNAAGKRGWSVCVVFNSHVRYVERIVLVKCTKKTPWDCKHSAASKVQALRRRASGALATEAWLQRLGHRGLATEAWPQRLGHRGLATEAWPQRGLGQAKAAATHSWAHASAGTKEMGPAPLKGKRAQPRAPRPQVGAALHARLAAAARRRGQTASPQSSGGLHTEIGRV